MVRVLIVDDYSLWRRLIVDMLAIRQDVHIVGEAHNGLTGIQMAAELQPDIVVLDIGLPDRNGIEVAKQILELSPQTKILFLSQNNSKDVICAAIRTGAHAYVVKSNANRDLLPAFEAVLKGNFFVGTSVFEARPREQAGTLVSCDC